MKKQTLFLFLLTLSLITTINATEKKEKKVVSPTNLFVAIKREDVKTVQEYIQANANIEATDKDGNTPLIYAVRWGNPTIINLLLRAKANIEARDNDGNTPLMYAVKRGDPLIVNLLLDRKANMEARDKDGKTPIIIATKLGNPEILNLLLGRGANINVMGKALQSIFGLEPEKHKEKIHAILGKITEKKEKEIEKYEKKRKKITQEIRQKGFNIPLPFATHTMLILLDDSEGYDRGFVGLELGNALADKACPILVSASLLTHYITLPEHYNKICAKFFEELKKLPANKDTIVAEYRKMRNALGSADDKEKFFNCATQQPFHPEQWYIRKPTPNLFLLIPKTYYPIGVKSYEPAHTAASSITAAELALGLKIDHMEIVSDAQMVPSNLMKTMHGKSSGGNSSNDFMDALERNLIFITKKEAKQAAYKFEKIQKPILWAIFLSGHGMINSKIAALSIDQFSRFLDFLNANITPKQESKITTKLLAVSSCYAAGFNEELVYHDFDQPFLDTKTKAEKRSYSFVIATEALTDSVVSIYPKSKPVVNLTEKAFTWPYRRDFSQFVRNVTGSDTLNVANALLPIFPFARIQIGRTFTNLPKVRLPGQHWFSVVDIDNRIASIGMNMARARKDPLDVQKFFAKKQLAALLLYTDTIPFELILNIDPYAPFAIIPMIPREATYLFNKISSTTLTFQHIIYSFAQLRGNMLAKAYYIQSIECTNEKSSKSPFTQEKIRVEDVILAQTGQYETSYKLWFTYNRNFYVANFIVQQALNNTSLDYQMMTKDSKDLNAYKETTKALKEGISDIFSKGSKRSAKIEKALSSGRKKRSDIASYQLFEMLREDPDFTKWRSKYEKKAPKEVETLIKQARESLLDKKKKKSLTRAEKEELSMLPKMIEFMKLQTWYQTLSADDKKVIEQEIKKAPPAEQPKLSIQKMRDFLKKQPWYKNVSDED